MPTAVWKGEAGSNEDSKAIMRIKRAPWIRKGTWQMRVLLRVEGIGYLFQVSNFCSRWLNLCVFWNSGLLFSTLKRWKCSRAFILSKGNCDFRKREECRKTDSSTFLCFFVVVVTHFVKLQTINILELLPVLGRRTIATGRGERFLLKAKLNFPPPLKMSSELMLFQLLLASLEVINKCAELPSEDCRYPLWQQFANL